jgi:hypothetical protein
MLLVVTGDSADAAVTVLLRTVILLVKLMMVLLRPDVLRCCGWWDRCWCYR